MYEQKGVPIGQARVISMTHNFHGRTLSIVSLSKEPSMRGNEMFGPFMSNIDTIEYGSVAALEEQLKHRFCGLLFGEIRTSPSAPRGR